MIDLLTVNEAAARLRIKPNTLRRWVCEKKIPHVKLGTRVLFRAETLEEWVKKNERAS